MKKMSFKSAMKPVLGGAMVLVLLAGLPAEAGSGLIKVTHSPDYAKSQSKTSKPVAAKVQSKAGPKGPEVQVAVMAKRPSQPAAKRSVFIHR